MGESPKSLYSPLYIKFDIFPRRETLLIGDRKFPFCPEQEVGWEDVPKSGISLRITGILKDRKSPKASDIKDRLVIEGVC